MMPPTKASLSKHSRTSEEVRAMPAAVEPNTEMSAVDLRSDTVTRPTEAMYHRMITAELGDDGLDGDPTVKKLESTTAHLLGKTAGLFVPSCTMANLLAVLAQVQRNEQVVLEAQAHMYTSERGSATFTGAFYVPVAGDRGAMNEDSLEETLTSKRHKLRTALVAVETSHNNAAGAVLPLRHLEAVQRLARDSNAAVHLDGARLFNAAVHLGISPDRITQHVDTVSLCLSKGLSAPVGAVLAGAPSVIDRARGLRRMLGGTQRQAGLMAAAGLEAVTTMWQRLDQDHSRARALSEALNKLHPNLSASIPQTNIIQVDISRTGRSSDDWVSDLERENILTRPWGSKKLRCVTHRHIGDRDIELAVAAFRRLSSRLDER
jgi:threonine aldolase